jgi:hypothetical protein
VVELVPDKAMPAVPAPVGERPDAWAERDPVADAESALRTVVTGAKVDPFDAAASELDGYFAAVKYVVAL